MVQECSCKGEGCEKCRTPTEQLRGASTAELRALCKKAGVRTGNRFGMVTTLAECPEDWRE